MRKIRFSHPYPEEHRLNLFGDYKFLVLDVEREKDEPGSPVTKTWTLVGYLSLSQKNQPTARCLTPEQATVALEALFFANAVRVLDDGKIT